MERVHKLLMRLSSSCVGCFIAHNLEQVPEHCWRDCEHFPSPRTQPQDWQDWKMNLETVTGYCRRCGCPQKVCMPTIFNYRLGTHCYLMQARYSDGKGGHVYIHGFNDGPSSHCEFEDILLPMMWLIQIHEPTRHIVTTQIRPGYDLDYVPLPFSQWVTRLNKDGVYNILRVLLQFEDLYPSRIVT